MTSFALRSRDLLGEQFHKYGVRRWKSLSSDENFEFSSEVYYRKIQKHREGCGKKDIRSKIYKFFTESYIHDVYVAHDQGARGKKNLKGSCLEASEKSEEPH